MKKVSARLWWWALLLFGALLLLASPALRAQETSDPELTALRADARVALRRAVAFFTEQVAREGGYLWRYSADLERREGEGKADRDTIWVQPPGTPAVGAALLDAWEATDEREHLKAAWRAARALVHGQLTTGGWDYKIFLDPRRRATVAYRADRADRAAAPDAPASPNPRSASPRDEHPPSPLEGGVRAPTGRGGGYAGGAEGARTHAESRPYGLKPRAPPLTPSLGPGFRVTTLDDDTTQSALRLLMAVDRALGGKDAVLHEAAIFGLESLLRAQYPNGAWPQRYFQFPDPARFPVLDASVPDDWPRRWPRPLYQRYYTLNDRAHMDVVRTLLIAAGRYDEPRYRRAALAGGDFLLRAQLPEPQPAWAQQYDFEMHPAWARKFEPPAVTGGESQDVIALLIELAEATGERRFLAPIPRALAYLRWSLLPDGTLARFYELGSNRPLYFTGDYQLTYDGSDAPTHYAFAVGARLDDLEREYRRVELPSPLGRGAGGEGPAGRERSPAPTVTGESPPRPGAGDAGGAGEPPPPLGAGEPPPPLGGRVGVGGEWEGEPSGRNASPPPTKSDRRRAREALDALDAQGRWVEPGRLKYHGDSDPTREVIDCETFARRVRALARVLR